MVYRRYRCNLVHGHKGFSEETNEMLQVLWQCGWPQDRNTWAPDRAFAMLWQQASKKPDHVPFAVFDIETIEREHRKFSAGDSYVYKLPNPFFSFPLSANFNEALMQRSPFKVIFETKTAC